MEQVPARVAERFRSEANSSGLSSLLRPLPHSHLSEGNGQRLTTPSEVDDGTQTAAHVDDFSAG